MSRRRDREKREKRIEALNYPTVPGGKERCFHRPDDYRYAGWRCPAMNDHQECMADWPF